MGKPLLIIYADGIGTAHISPEDERSTLRAVVNRLVELTDGAPIRVDWPASMAGVGGPMSWDRAARLGVEDIDRILVAYPGRPVVLLGYSGGAKVIHDWLDRHPEALGRVAAVGFLSDPFRPASRWQHDTPDPGGSGICGGRLGPISDRTYWTSFHDDVISSCPPDSPLRTLADLSDKIPGSFLEDVSEHLTLGNWQLANYIKLWKRDPIAYLRGLPARMNRARRGVEGYLGSAHTLAYTREFVTRPQDRPVDRRSLAHRLAETIDHKLTVSGGR